MLVSILKKIIESLIPGAIIVILWALGLSLCIERHERLGGFFFLCGTVVSVVFGIVFLLGLYDFLDSWENYPDKSLITLFFQVVVIVCLCFTVRPPMAAKVDWLYVQNVENPKIAEFVKFIQSDLDKQQALRDFMAGKQVKDKDALWFRIEDISNQMAVRRVLGVSIADVQKLQRDWEFPNRVTYLQIPLGEKAELAEKSTK